MTNRFRWLPLVFALFVGGCGGESAELQRQEAERVAEKAAKEAKEAEESATKQHREETLATIETLRKKHNATLSWRTPFNPTRKPKRDDDKTNYREESLFSRPLHSFEIQQILETTDETPFLFVGRLIDVIRDGTRCKCYFAVELRGNYVAVELESTELQAREIIRVSDAVSLDEDEEDEWFKRFAIVVREISVGPDRVIHGKLIDFAPVLINDEPVEYGGMSDYFDE